MADTSVDGLVVSGSQQQWFSRNSEFGSWTGSVWNMVFQRRRRRPAAALPEPVAHRRRPDPAWSREKPFLYVDGTGEYRVFVPALRTNTTGTSWYNKTPAGSSIPLSQFFVVHARHHRRHHQRGPRRRAAPALHPGRLPPQRARSRSTRPTPSSSASAWPPSQPDNGVAAMQVADVDGVKVAGIMFEAGTTNSPVLMEVGPAGSSASHAANPTSLHDVFFRIGGAARRQGHHQPADQQQQRDRRPHVALARRPRQRGAYGWTINTADTGLVVNGDNVTMYGLFVEHYQKYQTHLERQRRPDVLLPERDALRPAEPGGLDERRRPGATPPTRSPTR